MKNTFNLFLIFITFITIQKTAKAQLEYLGFGCSFGVVNSKQPSSNENNLLIRNHPSFSYYKGVLLRSNNDPPMDFGIGFTTVNAEREIQGVFPESNQFGVAVINTTLNYWSIPISLRFVRRNMPVVSISYIPSFLAFSKQFIQKYGGATESDYIKKYPKDFSIFQQSLICSLNMEFGGRHSIFSLNVNPYFGMGTGFLRDQKPLISNVMYGVGMSISFDVTAIHITRTTSNNPTLKKKEEELKKKQEEIEKKLNKK